VREKILRSLGNSRKGKRKGMEGFFK
jgi:hypothetical protein